MNIILVRIYARSNQKTSFYSNENNAIFHTNQQGVFREQNERTDIKKGVPLYSNLC